MYEKYKDEMKAEEYSTEGLKCLAARVYEELSKGIVPEAAVILATLPAEYSGEAAAVFSDDDYGDNMKAAQDAYNIIDDERFDRLSKQCIAEGNIAKLNELIKKKAEKKRKEGV